ncbi:MAG: epoxyqueuosine reductase [Bacteroidota bacterium]
MKEWLEQKVRRIIGSSGLDYYREPLFGYASASDPVFLQFKTVVGEDHLLPSDLLPEAQTVFAFFLPFHKEIIEHNRVGKLATREWARVYIDTNRLISRIGSELQTTLVEKQIQLVSQAPTYDFDKAKLIANWSHRHIAYACGLGTFGRNNLLITAKGCGGRLGTAVLDVPLKPSPRSQSVHNCFQDTKGCSYCQKICPVQALSDSVFNRQNCYQQLLINDQTYQDLELCDVCGKCATGPCGYIE